MRDLGLLLKLRLNESLGISSTLHEQDKRKKAQKCLHGVVMLLMAVIVVEVVTTVSLWLADIGCAPMLPVLGYMISSVITLVFTILSINNTLSGNQDIEFLMSMPFHSVTQVAVMFLLMYMKNLLWTLLVSGPMGIVYAMEMQVSSDFWGMWILGLLFTGLPASGIAALLGMIVAVLLCTSKNSNMIQSIISLGVIGGMLLLVVVMLNQIGNGLLETIHQNSDVVCQNIIDGITLNYKLGRFYQNGIVEQQPMWIFLFVLISVVWYGFFVFFLSMSYQELILALRSPVEYKQYMRDEWVQKDLKKALYKRELEQWLQSKSYMVSSLVGCVCAVFLAVAFLIKGANEWCAMFGLMPYFEAIKWCMPFVLCLFVGMSCTSYCAMSMEGRRHWIMQTMPVDEKVLKTSKVKLNLTITVPTVIVSAWMLCVAFEVSVIEGVLYFLIPLVYAGISAWWGICVDSKYADYSSESENQTMHQGMSFVLGYLPGIVIPVIAICLLIGR